MVHSVDSDSPLTQETNALPPDYELGEYRIASILGVGGFGITYKAWDTYLDTWVVIKEYFPAQWGYRAGDGISVHPTVQGQRQSIDARLSDYEWGLKRFLEEVRALTRIRHPDMIRVTRYFRANGSAYRVTDYEEGETLAALLQRQGTLSEERLRALLDSILPVLQAIHAQGRLHRSLEPANCYLRSRDGHVMLTGFGAGGKGTIGKRIRPGYSPPEDYASHGEHQGNWSDIYALGAVLYRCISGNRPQEATERLLDDDLQPALIVGAGHYSGSLLAVVDRALSLHPRDRYQDVDEMRSELERSADTDEPAAELKIERAEAESIESETRFPEPEVKLPETDVKLSEPEPQASEFEVEQPIPATPKKRKSRVIRHVFAALMILSMVPMILIGIVAYLWLVPGDDLQAIDIPRYVLKKNASPGTVILNPRLRPDTRIPEPEDTPEPEDQALPEESPVVADADMLEEQGAQQRQTQQEIEQFLNLAKKSLDNLRLTTPKDNSALFYYRQVLELDPDNAVAKKGITEVATRYAWLAKREFRRFNDVKAKRFIALGLSIAPSHPQLLALQAQASELALDEN